MKEKIKSIVLIFTLIIGVAIGFLLGVSTSTRNDTLDVSIETETQNSDEFVTNLTAEELAELEGKEYAPKDQTIFPEETPEPIID